MSHEDVERKSSQVRLKPNEYIHVYNPTTQITRAQLGPCLINDTQDSRVIQDRPQPFVVVPNNHYCVVANPVDVDEAGRPVNEHDSSKQVPVRLGAKEVRHARNPFPLYPGEELEVKPRRLETVAANKALHLVATGNIPYDSLDDEDRPTFEKPESGMVLAGTVWMLRGPTVCRPHVSVEVRDRIEPENILRNHALRLRAEQDLIDSLGKCRTAGEEWLIRTVGAYLRRPHENVVEITRGITLDAKTALHVKAKYQVTTLDGRVRKAGEVWLVSADDTDAFIEDVHETVVKTVELVTLAENQWCRVRDPYDPVKGANRLGDEEIRRGRQSFFLHPGEQMVEGPKEALVLDKSSAVLVEAKESVKDEAGNVRNAGDRWLVQGPCHYVPLKEIAIREECRTAKSLEKKEGWYVRNLQTGKITLVRGPRLYMLEAHEEKWNKRLPQIVERLLEVQSSSSVRMLRTDLDAHSDRGSRVLASRAHTGPEEIPEADLVKRELHQAATFHVPINAAVQIHDYEKNETRVEVGPAHIMLEPYEAFTVINLSGNRPKKPNIMTSIALSLGPDYMGDKFTVETVDHAKLELELAYSWHFDCQLNTDKNALFSISDFVGHACTAIASRVRGRVSSLTFEEFHEHSARQVREAVFGSVQGKIRDKFVFPGNGLTITNIDVQSVAPVDKDVVSSLERSVQLAMSVRSKAYEDRARHQAAIMERQNEAELELAQIQQERNQEFERSKLIELKSENLAKELSMKSRAEAIALAEAARIRGELERELNERSREGEDQQAFRRHEAWIGFLERENELDVKKAEKLALIKSNEYRSFVESLGPDTIASLATAGPEAQAKVLTSLGLRGLVVTDGETPINLFRLADGLMGKNED